jgi:hypothetical protein
MWGLKGVGIGPVGKSAGFAETQPLVVKPKVRTPDRYVNAVLFGDYFAFAVQMLSGI